MKRMIVTRTNNISESVKATDSPKLPRTKESGHNLDTPIVFNNMDEYKAWFKEDAMYED